MAKAPIITHDNSASTTTQRSSSKASKAAPVEEPLTLGKGRPTPSRKEREAANLRPLVARGKEAQKARRERVSEERNRARTGLANGEEKFLPARDKGPQRKFVRDYIDARYSVGEAMIPIMVIVIVLSIVPAAATATLYVLWAFFFVAIVDVLLLGQRLRSKLAAKYGAENVESGLRWYAAMRAMQMKPMRMPKGKVKRGDFPQ